MVVGSLLAGALINIAATFAIAQFSNHPPAAISSAQEFAMQKVFKEPNPTPPIWPEFNQRGWGVSFIGLHPRRESAVPEPDSYLRVLIQVGFPLRCVSTTMEYKKSGVWSNPTSVLQLSTRRGGATGRKIIPRILPLEILWPQLVVNSLIYAAALFGAWWSVFRLRRMLRTRRNLCPMCAYPTGASPVCTECGAALSAAVK